MPTVTDADTILGRIAALANEAAARPDLPPALKPILAEIEALAKQRGGDTPEASDISSTANQTL